MNLDIVLTVTAKSSHPDAYHFLSVYKYFLL